MKYVVNVSSLTNMIGDKDFFFGTGFFGEEFSSKEELRDILNKYVCTDKNRPYYATKNFKLTFSNASTIADMKEEGNRQCRENGMVELFSVVAKCRKDPYFGKEVYFFVGGKYETNPSEVFHYLLYNKNTKQYTPIYGGISKVLEVMEINF